MSIYLPWQSGFAVGDGVDVVTGARVATGRRGIEPEVSSYERTDVRAVSPSTNIYVRESDFKEALDVAVQVAGKGLGWNASAQARVRTKMQVDRKSVVVQRTATARTEAHQVSVSQPLSDTAQGVLDTEGADGFRSQYGTHFISGYILGGSFVGRLVHETSDERSALRIEAALKGNVSKGVDVQAAVEAAYGKKSGLRVSRSSGSCVVNGGDTEDWHQLVEINTLSGMKNAQESFLDSIGTTTDSVPIIAMVSPWSRLDAVPVEVGRVGPESAQDDALGERALDRLAGLEYFDALGQDGVDSDAARTCRARLEDALRSFRSAPRALIGGDRTGTHLDAARDELEAVLDETDAWIQAQRERWTFDVHYSAQYHVAHKALRVSLEPWRTNTSYPSLRASDGTVAVELGQIVDVATLSYGGDRNIGLRVCVGVDRDSRGKPRVGAYFGYAGQVEPALESGNDPSKSMSSWEFASIEPGTYPSKTTERAKSMRNDSHRDNCFIRARVIEPAPRTTPAG